MADYRDKIRKLLALAESPNENEAKKALLKAKQLMAEHKIAEVDLEEIKIKKVKRIDTGYEYTKRGEFWMSTMAHVIAENYCCRSASSVYHGKQKRTIIFVGLEDDVDLCAMIFKYAVDSARALAKEHAKELSKKYAFGFTAKEKSMAVNSYILGFSNGVQEAFKEQKEAQTADESTWGLVMVTPKEVNDFCSDFRKDRYVSRHSVNSDSMSHGFAEGKKFNPERRIS